MSYRTNGDLQCDMRADCSAPVTHVDEKGYVYCAEHGEQRKSVRACRRLATMELRQLRMGMPLAKY